VLAAAARSTDPAFELLGATWPGLADGARGDARGDAVASSLPPVPPPLHGPLVMVDRASARLGRALLTAPGRPRGKLWLGAAAFVGLVAGGASLYDRELQRSSTSALASTLELDAERLAAAVEAGVQLATARATGLAADPVLRAAIETDAATLHDLAREAPAFAIGAGETLEVVQRRAGATISLLHLPANAPAIVEPTGGAARVVTVDGVLTVIASVPVAPSSTAGASAGISGVVTLAARLDLGSATAQLARHVRAAALRGPGFELDLVASPGAAGGVVSVVPLPSARAPGALSLVSRLATVVQPSDWVRPVQLAGASLGVLLLACFAWPRGRQHDQEILHDEGHSTARAMSWRATRSSRRRRRATSTAAVSVPAYKRRTA